MDPDQNVRPSRSSVNYREERNGKFAIVSDTAPWLEQRAICWLAEICGMTPLGIGRTD